MTLAPSTNQADGERRRAAVYRLFDADGGLLYIGSAYDPDERCMSHRGKPWWPLVARRTDEWHPTRGHAYHAEMKAIATEHAKHNLMGAPTYCTPQTEAVLRRNEKARQRGRAQAMANRIRAKAVDAHRASGASWGEAHAAGEAAALAHLEETGLFPAYVARARRQAATASAGMPKTPPQASEKPAHLSK